DAGGGRRATPYLPPSISSPPLHLSSGTVYPPVPLWRLKMEGDGCWLSHLLILGLVTAINGVCDLPSQWRGGWFQSGVRDIISLTRTEFSSKGICLHSSGEKFLFKDR
ncbi:hypothetical protein OTU49_012112, partial [Cherax quadricarinatus]